MIKNNIQQGTLHMKNPLQIPTSTFLVIFLYIVDGGEMYSFEYNIIYYLLQIQTMDDDFHMHQVVFREAY